MRALVLLLSLVALVAFIGCGDTDPISSTGDQTFAAPAAKLTVSQNIVGG